jgi:hypothetical protein
LNNVRVLGLGFRVWKLALLVLAIPYTLYPIPFLMGCYSFTGASIPPHIHTIGIPLIEDNSGFGEATVRSALTDQITQQFTEEGSLRVANRSSSDAVLEVSVPSGGISDMPVSIRAGDEVTTKRVTLSVHAIYRDQVKQKVFWERDFSQTADYRVSQSLTGFQAALKQAEINVSKDLVLSAISNW